MNKRAAPNTVYMEISSGISGTFITSGGIWTGGAILSFLNAKIPPTISTKNPGNSAHHMIKKARFILLASAIT